MARGVANRRSALRLAFNGAAGTGLNANVCSSDRQRPRRVPTRSLIAAAIDALVVILAVLALVAPAQHVEQRAVAIDAGGRFLVVVVDDRAL
jgi:hypothetical protein